MNKKSLFGAYLGIQQQILNNFLNFCAQSRKLPVRAMSTFGTQIFKQLLMHKILHIMQLYAKIPTFFHATDMKI